MNQKIISNKRVVGNKKGSGTIIITALLLLSIFAIAANNLTVNQVSAATAPPLGAWSTLVILAHTAITSAGNAATITGNVASDGLGSGIGVTCTEVSGTIYSVDGNPIDSCVAHSSTLPTTAQTDWVTANNALDQTPCIAPYIFGTGIIDLVGATLVPGVYCADYFTLSGTLHLSGSGVWIFKSAYTLITSGTANVVGGDPCNVWWRVGSAATLGTNTQLIGSIFANTAITLATGATLNGQALSHTANVVLDHNHVYTTCAAPPAGSTTTTVTSIGSSATTTTTTEGNLVIIIFVGTAIRPPIYYPVGGEMLRVDSFTVLLPWLLLISALAIIILGTIAVKKRS